VSNLQQRVISALVLAALVLALTWFGDWPYRVLAAGIGAAIFYEWARMAGTVGRSPELLSATVLLALALGALVFGYSAAAVGLMIFVAAVVSLVTALVFGGSRWIAPGVAYAGLSALALAFVRDSDLSGLKATLFLFAVVWATDICAYFVGRAVGGPKLAPAISPGKTWSGAVGGVAGAVLSGLAATVLAGGLVDAFNIAIIIFLSIVSQIGDLFESWVKRRHGAKDSSQLIPGHGGVMDRVDGLVAAAFALYVIGWMTAGADVPAHGLFPA
jgi:phosphatidate cytidylyltransferase